MRDLEWVRICKEDKHILSLDGRRTGLQKPNIVEESRQLEPNKAQGVPGDAIRSRGQPPKSSLSPDESQSGRQGRILRSGFLTIVKCKRRQGLAKSSAKLLSINLWPL